MPEFAPRSETKTPAGLGDSKQGFSVGKDGARRAYTRCRIKDPQSRLNAPRRREARLKTRQRDRCAYNEFKTAELIAARDFDKEPT
jgi:hypothetical protein